MTDALLEISASDIGLIANRELLKAPAGHTLAGTSRGLFLMLASGWVVYLSPEKYRGPLTLNIPGYLSRMHQSPRGAGVTISPKGIHLHAGGYFVRIDEARPWQPPAPSGILLAPEQRRATLAQLTYLAGESPVVSMAQSSLAGLSAEQAAPTALEGLLLALQERRLDGIVGYSEALLGLGPGLTPSGDDLVAGMLLALNRWGDALAPDLDVSVLNRTIPLCACRKTTTLGANLIDCAAQGQANERLILALDGIMTGEPGVEACAALLAGWGSSSGRDALAGMSLVIRSFC